MKTCGKLSTGTAHKDEKVGQICQVGVGNKVLYQPLQIFKLVTNTTALRKSL